MKEASTAKVPRDLENLIVRVPASIRQQIAKEAEDQKISQNQLINGYLFTVLFVQHAVPQLGDPRHLLRLFTMIESGLNRADGLVFGAFNKEDWDDVSGHLDQFSSACLITPTTSRSEPSLPSTVAFTFSVTRYGRQQLKILMAMLTPSLQERESESSTRARTPAPA